ncbi:MAG: hypothetical protein IJF37_04455 [Lachnospiraceae bacterium]|nr:hypothetical protein [Lachnospiraceae bacterium]
MEWIETGTTTVTSIFTGVLNICTSNPLLTACLTAGVVIPLGVKVFRKFRKM